MSPKNQFLARLQSDNNGRSIPLLFDPLASDHCRSGKNIRINCSQQIVFKSKKYEAMAKTKKAAVDKPKIMGKQINRN